jgi:hypothetical protein
MHLRQLNIIKFVPIKNFSRKLHGSTIDTKTSLPNKLFKNVTSLPLTNIQVRHASAFKFVPDTASPDLGETTKMNLCQSVTNALDISLSGDKSAGIFRLIL